MYKLTDRRLEQAEVILEKYRKQLFSAKRIDCRSFERELRELWSLGFAEFKDIMNDMVKNEDYRLVATYYMQHEGTVGPSAQFKSALCKLYGMKVYDPADKEGKRKAFWGKALK